MTPPTADLRAACWELAGQCTAVAERGAPGFESALRAGAWHVLTTTGEAGNWFAFHGDTPAITAQARELADRLDALQTSAGGWVSPAVIETVMGALGETPVNRWGVSPLMLCEGRPRERVGTPYAGTVRAARADEAGLAFGVIAHAFGVPEEATASIWTEAVDRPGMTVHLAEHDGIESVCVAYTPADLCYIYVMATEPDRQRRGAGYAVLSHVMNGLVDRGIDRFTLLASGQGRPLYEAMGYDVIDAAEFWSLNRPS
ncbi:MAG: GNAT family N-acetyltransferase [Thermomicrobiales bacterium]